ncbi:hypothetical protein [Klebsiella pneumoniae]|uniref:hypothetical protein n=1 Tax=Klebsiella pneumoniae TaxID=573 RepID=UPI000AAAEE0A|nr:hypothetical protein [Klebsiella pneumoniae]MBL9314705.1 hypothetical protein [Klebsiella pneumoniae]
MAYAFLCRFFGRKYRFSSDFAIIYLVCLPGNMGSEKGESLKKRYPAYKRDWLVILMLNNFNKKQRATTLLLFLAGNNLRFVN